MKRTVFRAFVPVLFFGLFAGSTFAQDGTETDDPETLLMESIQKSFSDVSSYTGNMEMTSDQSMEIGGKTMNMNRSSTGKILVQHPFLYSRQDMEMTMEMPTGGAGGSENRDQEMEIEMAGTTRKPYRMFLRMDGREWKNLETMGQQQLVRGMRKWRKPEMIEKIMDDASLEETEEKKDVECYRLQLTIDEGKFVDQMREQFDRSKENMPAGTSIEGDPEISINYIKVTYWVRTDNHLVRASHVESDMNIAMSMEMTRAGNTETMDWSMNVVSSNDSVFDRYGTTTVSEEHREMIRELVGEDLEVPEKNEDEKEKEEEKDEDGEEEGM